MPVRSEPVVLLDRMAFAECPTWHDGRLWFLDSHDERVWAMTEEGQPEPVLRLDDRPGGLGWTPDGAMVLTLSFQRCLVRWAGDDVEPVCDLSPFSPHPWNDLLVDDRGAVYVTGHGRAPGSEHDPDPSPMVRVAPDGRAWVAVEGLRFPNGAAVLAGPSGRTLVVAETFAQRLSAYDLGDDGSLSRARVWADLRPNFPDGVAADAAGAIWVTDPITNGVMRVVEGRGVVEWIPSPEPAFGCALGGSDGRTLYLCTSPTSDPARTTADAPQLGPGGAGRRPPARRLTTRARVRGRRGRSGGRSAAPGGAAPWSAGWAPPRRPAAPPPRWPRRAPWSRRRPARATGRCAAGSPRPSPPPRNPLARCTSGSRLSATRVAAGGPRRLTSRSRPSSSGRRRARRNTERTTASTLSQPGGAEARARSKVSMRSAEARSMTASSSAAFDGWW